MDEAIAQFDKAIRLIKTSKGFSRNWDRSRVAVGLSASVPVGAVVAFGEGIDWTEGVLPKVGDVVNVDSDKDAIMNNLI